MSFDPQQELTKTAFGELSVAEPTPIVQISAQYGLHEQIFTFFTPGASVVAEDSLFKCRSGTSPISTSSIISNRRVPYRGGQGIVASLSAIFATGLADSIQAAGFISATDLITFAFVGVEFGILHGRGGKVEIQELTVTTPAAGSESATVTIDGTGFTVPLTAGTTEHNAFEISESLNAQVLGYDFTSNESTVVSASLLAGPQGSFAFTSSTAVAAWVQITAGVLRTDFFTKQADWNVDNVPDLDPTKGNDYKIKYKFLGFGGIKLFVEDVDTATPRLVHIIKYGNKNILPSSTDPIFRVGWAVQNAGNTTSLELSGASLGGAVEGKVVLSPGSTAADHLAVNIPTTGQTNLISIRNRLVFGDKRNRTETRLLFLTVSTDSSRGSIIRLLINPTYADTVNFTYIDKEGSTTEIAKEQVLVTGGQFVGSFVTSQAGTLINLNELSATVLAQETMAFVGTTVSGAPADISISVTAREDL